MLRLSDFDYTLPPERIAHSAVEPRDSSRLLVFNRSTGQITDTHFSALPDFLSAGDVIVRNNTKVLPARLHATKKSGGKVEILLVKKTQQTAQTETWECLTKPGLKIGTQLECASSLSATCTSLGTNDYTRLLTFNRADTAFLEILNEIGSTPLPPYISAQDTTDELAKRYQTLYASSVGSVAAPTAGLHFTRELDSQLREKGIVIVEVTLHVGLGTFLPVKETVITNHHMHSEWFEITPAVATTIQTAKNTGKRIVAIGTTSTRVLETVTTQTASGEITVGAQTGETAIYIFPPYTYVCVDALVTNFHLPKSTLLMLIAAFTSSPNTTEKFTNFSQSKIGHAYEHAIKNEYRFYSFGDAMLIL